jgi:predicted nucleic acid-binding protein
VSGFLLDTNVLSELERQRGSPRVLAFLKHTPLSSLFISEVVIAEIRFGIEAAASPARRDRLMTWLKDTVRPLFENRILRINEDILVRWRWIVEMGRRRGYTFDQFDSLIGATAAHYNLTVLTRDTEPFEGADVACLNPWQPH